MKEIELYFIQFLFCTNRELLLREFRPLYDALLGDYQEIYRKGKSVNADLMQIDKEFLKKWSLIKSKKRAVRLPTNKQNGK